MGPISWGYIDMAVLLLLLTLMNLHSFCCPFSSSYHVFPFSTFAVIRQQSLSRVGFFMRPPWKPRDRPFSSPSFSCLCACFWELWLMFSWSEEAPLVSVPG